MFMRSFFPNAPIGNSLSSNLITFCPAVVPANLRATCLASCTKGYVQGKKDCLTSIADLFKKIVPDSQETVEWALDFIANMPCQLLDKYGFTPSTGMKPGHILFVANEKGLIRHIVIGIPPESNPNSTEITNEIFHCSQLNQGGKIETLAELFAVRKNKRKMYCEIKSLPLLLSQRDPRTEESRVPAIIALGKKMLAPYLIPPNLSPRTTPLPFFARLVTYKPTEEIKENAAYISVIIPKSIAPFPNLTKCSPIYFCDTNLVSFPTKGSQSDLHMLDRTPEGSPRSRAPASPRSRVATFQALSIHPVRGSSVDLTMYSDEPSPSLRRSKRLTKGGSQVNLPMLDSTGISESTKVGS